MLDELQKAVDSYWQTWQTLVTGRKNKAFFRQLRPTAVCLKVADLGELDKRVLALRTQADHIHWGWINDRWLVTVHLRDSKLPHGIEIIKLYQRRPGSTDAVGLDHLDFFAPQIDEDMLADEPDLQWTHETNGQHCSWISLWFSGTEAKLRTNTTADVCAKELQDINDSIVKGTAK